MAMTLRLPEALEAEAMAYAAALGLSFTNIVAVALRDYLDARPARKIPAGSAEPVGGPLPAQGGGPPVGSKPPQVPPASGVKLSPADRLVRKAQAKRAGGEP